MRVLRRPIACLLFLWYLPACTSYQTTNLAPQQAVAWQDKVRVTVGAADGREATVTLKEPWVRRDSLGGLRCRKTRNHSPSSGTTCGTWSTSLNSVVRIERARSPSKETTTTIGVLALAAAGVGAVFLLGLPKPNDDPCTESVASRIGCKLGEAVW